MWREGSLKAGGSIIKYWIKQYETGSEYGINEGRISKLMMTREDKVIANYDRGWDLEPIDSQAELALAILLKQHN